MGHNEHGRGPLAAEAAQGQQHHLGRGCVQAGAGLIGEQHGRIIGQSACHSHALLLAPRELRRSVGETRLEAKLGEEITGPLALRTPRDGIGEAHGEHDVLQGRERSQ